MLRKLLTAVGLGTATVSAAAGAYSPYSVEAANQIYNLLFCDQADAFKPGHGQKATAWQLVLFSEPLDTAAALALADDRSQDGRVRYLAYSRLRQLGQSVTPKQLLGVIVEMPLGGGLDVLAAYSDGSVRYINQTGEMAIFEGVTPLQPLVQALFAASEPLVARIGPSDQARRPPPKLNAVRLTFLVSDGLYFGEGPVSHMQRDAMAGPVIQRATQLLQAVVSKAAK